MKRLNLINIISCILFSMYSFLSTLLIFSGQSFSNTNQYDLNDTSLNISNITRYFFSILMFYSYTNTTCKLRKHFVACQASIFDLSTLTKAFQLLSNSLFQIVFAKHDNQDYFFLFKFDK